jgi:hypothetical protein
MGGGLCESPKKCVRFLNRFIEPQAPSQHKISSLVIRLKFEKKTIKII